MEEGGGGFYDLDVVKVATERRWELVMSVSVWVYETGVWCPHVPHLLPTPHPTFYSRPLTPPDSSCLGNPQSGAWPFPHLTGWPGNDGPVPADRDPTAAAAASAANQPPEWAADGDTGAGGGGAVLVGAALARDTKASTPCYIIVYRIILDGIVFHIIVSFHVLLQCYGEEACREADWAAHVLNE
jgi:hypothetical protein